MTHLTNDVKEKLEISYKIMSELEAIITVICGEKRKEEKEAEVSERLDSVFKDMDKLNANLLRILKDVEVLDTMISGNIAPTCDPCTCKATV